MLGNAKEVSIMISQILRASVTLPIAVIILTSQQAVALSPLAEAWAERLHLSIHYEDPVMAAETCSGINGRFKLHKISEEDHLVLSNACSQATKRNWRSARAILEQHGAKAPASLSP